MFSGLRPRKQNMCIHVSLPESTRLVGRSGFVFLQKLKFAFVHLNHVNYEPEKKIKAITNSRPLGERGRAKM